MNLGNLCGIRIINPIDSRGSEGLMQLPIGRHATTGNIAGLSRCAAGPAIAPQPLVVVRIVHTAGDNLATIPAECRAAALHRAPHLVATVDLEDARTALRAGPRLSLDCLRRLDLLRLTGVLTVLRLTQTDKTVGAGPFGARPALVC